MSKTKRPHLVTTNSGLTLVELLMSIVAGSFVIVFAGLVIQASYFNYFAIDLKLKNEDSVNNAAVALQSYLSMALNLSEAVPPLTQFKDNEGQIRKFDLNDWTPSTGPGKIETIAYFLRETLPSGLTVAAPTGSARFPLTGIFFQRPTLDKYGVLYLHTTADNRGVMMPSASDIKIDYVVDFEIENLTVNTFFNSGDYDMDIDLNKKNLVSNVLAKVTIRNFFNKSSLSQDRWCPERFIASNPACATTNPYKDTQKTFLITIRNNILSRGMSQRSLGLTNPAQSPPAYRRSADTVYFLKPNIPVGVTKR